MKSFFFLIKKLKFPYLIILIAILISVVTSFNNLNKFDKIKINHNNKFYNQLLYEDLANNWHNAHIFKKKLDDGQNFFQALPSYDKFFLPNIFIGLYYYIINEEILEIKDNQKIIKTNNYKFGILLIQIILYYISIFYLIRELSTKLKKFNVNIITVFLSLEPSLLQWHSSFWTESIFLSFMVIIFTLLLKKSNSILINFIVGILVALMFAQRSVSFLFIIPILLYYFLIYKKNVKPYFFLLTGYSLIILLIGLNNFKEKKYFYILSKDHQYVSYYHYFAGRFLADREKLSKEEAFKVLEYNENQWKSENKIDLNNFEDYSKIINYRNNVFLDEVRKNLDYFFISFFKGALITAILHPTWVYDSYFVDKTDPEAIKNPKGYYNKNILRNIIYSIFIYFFVLLGFFEFFKKILIKKKVNHFEIFLILNILSMMYFLGISSMWANPKYFAPCIINISFFFAEGVSFLRNKTNIFQKC